MQSWDELHAMATTEPVARIMYASVAAIEGSIYEEMEKIRTSAVRHNEPAGVATALLYQSGWFVQWKEGPGEALLRIMDRVSGDSRHNSLRIVHSSRGPRLLDGPWSMAVVHCADKPAEMMQRVNDLRRQMEAGVHFGPPAIWRRLSTPMRHVGAMRQQDPEAFQRVLVCCAGGMDSFGLVQWLAEKRGEEVVHRRFFGAQDLDVGTDYVDVAYGERVLRLIAMARNGLHLPLTRAFLPDYSHLVLLLSGHAARDQLLLEKVVQACARLARPPVLLAVAEHTHNHVEPYALARKYGLVYLQAQAAVGDPAATWAAIDPILACWQHKADSGVPLVPLVPLRRLGSVGAGQQDGLVHLADIGAAAEGH
jgi:hypothetical protein